MPDFLYRVHLWFMFPVRLLCTCVLWLCEFSSMLYVQLVHGCVIHLLYNILVFVMMVYTFKSDYTYIYIFKYLFWCILWRDFLWMKHKLTGFPCLKILRCVCVWLTILPHVAGVVQPWASHLLHVDEKPEGTSKTHRRSEVKSAEVSPNCFKYHINLKHDIKHKQRLSLIILLHNQSASLQATSRNFNKYFDPHKLPHVRVYAFQKENAH